MDGRALVGGGPGLWSRVGVSRRRCGRAGELATLRLPVLAAEMVGKSGNPAVHVPVPVVGSLGMTLWPPLIAMGEPRGLTGGDNAVPRTTSCRGTSHSVLEVTSGSEVLCRPLMLT